MKRLYLTLLLVLLAVVSITTYAKDPAWWVKRTTLCHVINDSTVEELADFTKNEDASWTLANFSPTPMMEMRIRLHYDYGDGNAWDSWIGGPNGDKSFAITSSMLGNQIQGDNPGQTFYFKHNGTFTIDLSTDDIDYNCFTVTGAYSPGFYLTGQFNQWGETPFTPIGDGYTLIQKMYGEFLVKDQNDVLHGAVTDDERYTIIEANPSVTLTSNEGKKNLFLADESEYTFNLDNGVLTVSNWPEESITGVIRGATTEEWAGNVIEFPMEWDWVSGKFVSEQVEVPEGYRFQVIKHSSLTSVTDRWFGADGDFSVTVEGSQDISLSENSVHNIIFERDGSFKFSVNPDFTSLHIEGDYHNYESYYLIGDFNGWSQDTKVPFTREGSVYTVTQTLGREFLIIDDNGNYLGGATTGSHYELHENWPSVTLATDEQGKKNLYIDNEANYTFTIENGVLTVSGWTDEVISCLLLGATDDQWEGNELNFEMTIDNATGSYTSGVLSIPEGYRFQVVKHSSMTSISDEWFGVEENAFFVTEDRLGINIPVTSNSQDIHFDRAGVFDFTVAPDFSSVTINGRFEEEAEDAYYLIGDFNNWDENSMVKFTDNDGEYSLEYEFYGDFLIVDQHGTTYGADIAGDRFVFTVNGNNEVLSSAERKKNFHLEMPAPYTITISGRMIFVDGFLTHAYYLCGDFNEWKPEVMTDNDDGTFTITKIVSQHDNFKFRDQDGNWYGGDTQGNGDTYGIHSEWYSDVPMTMGDNGSNFSINQGGKFNFTLKESNGNLLLTVTGFNAVSLAELLEGQDGIIKEELTVAFIKDDKVYVTNGADWLRIDEVTNASDLQPGDVIRANTVSGYFSGQGTTPSMAIYTDLQIVSNTTAPAIETIELGGVFDTPKPNQVVYLIGYYSYNDNALFADENREGQCISLQDADGLNSSIKYKLTAAIEYTESTAAPAPKRRGGGSDLSNMQARVLAEPEVIDSTTGVSTIGANTDVLNVKYVNATGQMSSKPFDGMNIVVTTHRDGTTKAVKVVK